MKAILMSIRPQHTCNILNGIKFWEIRKKFPKDYVGWVYIYCTKDKKYANLINRGGFLTGMVVARFWCDKVEEIFTIGMYYHETKTLDKNELPRLSCLSHKDLDNYLQGETGYAIHINDLEIFDKPKEIGEFMKKLDNFDGINCWRCSNRHNCLFNRDKKCEKLKLTRAPQSWQYIEA